MRLPSKWLNVCDPLPSTKCTRWNPNSQCDGIWRWDLWEGIRSWGWSSFASSAMWGHSKKTAAYESENWLSPDTGPAGTLTWDFPASRTVRRKCVLLKPHPVYGNLLQQHKLRHHLLCSCGLVCRRHRIEADTGLNLSMPQSLHI